MDRNANLNRRISSIRSDFEKRANVRFIRWLLIIQEGAKACLEGVPKMNSLAILQSLKESIVTANVKAVYGEPIAAQGKTVIPVAKIIYGYGGGAGTGAVGNAGVRSEGGGGGGGARAIPVGVVEISDQQTRFVPITDRRKLAGAVVMGIGLGLWLGWRRRH
jgi:uncharacterized spore protein YtfJ